MMKILDLYLTVKLTREAEHYMSLTAMTGHWTEVNWMKKYRSHIIRNQYQITYYILYVI